MTIRPTAEEITNPNVTNAQQKSNLSRLTNFIGDLLGSDSASKTAAINTLGALSRDMASITAIATGTGDEMAVSLTPQLTGAIPDQFQIRVRVPGENMVDNPTINVDGLGAVEIRKHDNKLLRKGDIVGNHTFLYSANYGAWVVLDPVYSDGGDGVPVGVISHGRGPDADVGYIKLAEDVLTYWPIAGFEGKGITDLVTRCYVGDAENDTALAYFKCNVDGTVRSTAGEYFALPSQQQIEGRFVVEVGQTGRIKWRKYNDGFCYQSGSFAPGTNIDVIQTVTLPVKMADAAYDVSVNTGSPQTSALAAVRFSGINRTATTFQSYASTNETTFAVTGYADASEIPQTLPGILQIKAWDDAINTAGLDFQALVNAIQAFQEATLPRSADENRSTILYPGGTAESPANITINKRIVMDNPYPEHYAHCVVELYYNGKWRVPGWYTDASGGNSRSFGVQVHHVPHDDTLVVQSGSGYVLYLSLYAGGAFESVAAGQVTLPYRLIVTRQGRINP